MAYEWRIIFLTIFNGHTFTQKLPIFLISPFFLSNHPMTNAHRPISYHRLRKAVVFPGPRTATNWSFTSSPDISLYSGGQQGICCCLVRWHILSPQSEEQNKHLDESKEGGGGGVGWWESWACIGYWWQDQTRENRKCWVLTFPTLSSVNILAVSNLNQLSTLQNSSTI